MVKKPVNWKRVAKLLYDAMSDLEAHTVEQWQPAKEARDAYNDALRRSAQPKRGKK